MTSMLLTHSVLGSGLVLVDKKHMDSDESSDVVWFSDSGSDEKTGGRADAEVLFGSDEDGQDQEWVQSIWGTAMIKGLGDQVRDGLDMKKTCVRYSFIPKCGWSHCFLNMFLLNSSRSLFPVTLIFYMIVCFHPSSLYVKNENQLLEDFPAALVFSLRAFTCSSSVWAETLSEHRRDLLLSLWCRLQKSGVSA